MRSRLVVAAAVGGAALGLAILTAAARAAAAPIAPDGSARGQGDAPASPSPAALGGAEREASLRAAERRVVAYFASPGIVPDPGWISLFGYMQRRFAVSVRGGDGRPLHEARAGVARAEIFAIYRRIDDPSATVDKRQIAELPTAIDRISASALHCDRIALPENWLEILGRATRAGAYALTHAVLATEWSVENGCLRRAQVADLHREQVIRLADLIERRDELAGRYDAATDIWLEAIVMLYYSGAGGRVRGGWIDAMLAQQRPDGGWPRAPRAARSDPHASALALWILLENLDPRPPIAWIRRP